VIAKPSILSEAWTGLRRPLLVALVIGCAASLMDAGVLTLRLALPTAIWWTYVPLVEILALFAASPAARRAGSWPQTIDRYFMGHGPALLWVVALAGCFAFIPAVTEFSWQPRDRVALDLALLVIAWSAYIDFQFFRRVLKQNAWRAARDLLVQRAIAWTVGLTIFVGGAGYQTLAVRLGL
jgi:hypothetical protein